MLTGENPKRENTRQEEIDQQKAYKYVGNMIEWSANER